MRVRNQRFAIVIALSLSALGPAVVLALGECAVGEALLDAGRLDEARAWAAKTETTDDCLEAAAESDVDALLDPESTRNLASELKRGLAFLIRAGERVTNAEYSTNVGVRGTTVDRHLERLERAGFIKREGQRRLRRVLVLDKGRRAKSRT